MIPWLAQRRRQEQPLKEGDEASSRALPKRYCLFMDESCRTAKYTTAHAVHGVNMKLMKCGGIMVLEIIVKQSKLWA